MHSEKPAADAAQDREETQPRFQSAPTRGGRYALLVVNDKYECTAFAKLVARSSESPTWKAY